MLTEIKFKEIANAYEVLSDHDSRAAYDRGGQQTQPGSKRSWPTRSADDVFKEFFGGKDPFADFTLGQFGAEQPRQQQRSSSSSFSFSFSNGRITSQSKSETVTDASGRRITRKVSSTVGTDGVRRNTAEVEEVAWDGSVNRERRELHGDGSPSSPPVAEAASVEPDGECLAFRRTAECSPVGFREPVRCELQCNMCTLCSPSGCSYLLLLHHATATRRAILGASPRSELGSPVFVNVLEPDVRRRAVVSMKTSSVPTNVASYSNFHCR
eukprot:SAG31_NODE_3773_length_3894_cov_3.633922_3_plen_269_part_00